MTTIPILSLLAAALPAYLAGAIPFGLVLGKALRGVDIREHGSKNLGATNALRVLGAPIGGVVFALDFAKGFVPVFSSPALARAATPSIDEAALAWCALAAALAAVLGHVFPAYLGFRGGKGVATGAGVLAALAPLPTAIAVAVFALVVALTRWVSLGSLAAAVVLPAAAMRAEAPVLIAAVGISVLVVVKHRGNISRLLAGTEPRIGSKTEHTVGP